VNLRVGPTSFSRATFLSLYVLGFRSSGAARLIRHPEGQMQELVATQKGLEDPQASQAGDGQRGWSFLGQADVALASFGFSPIRGGDVALEAGVVLPLLDSAGR
jgi:hypothetical protein